MASDKGKVILDCGATESIGGLNAVEGLMEKLKSLGREINVDLSDRPTYGFGNGEQKSAMGAVSFQ
eukprot:6080174-Alexandrium_andersonii.AAC.1